LIPDNKDEYADVPGLGRIHIKPERGGFRIYHDKKPLGSGYELLAVARGQAQKFVDTFEAGKPS
jgi:hypothetical protein